MHKRGQIYILAAIILAFIIFGLVSVVNRAEQQNLESDFEKLSSNYEKESAKLVNSLLIEQGANEQDVQQKFQLFTSEFTSYAKAKNSDFGLIYAFNFGGNLYVGNFIDEDIQRLECLGGGCITKTDIRGCYDKIDASIELGDLSFDTGGISWADINTEGCLTTTSIDSGAQVLKLTIGDYNYKFDILPNQPQVMLLSHERKGEGDREQRKIYVPQEQGVKLYE